MEFKMKIARLKGRALPLNYQYTLSSWIYKVIAKADREYATFLHSEGHLLGGKHFKLFTFSRLNIRPFKIEEDRILIQGEEITLNVRFLVNRSMENFIRGLFLQKRFSLGDWKSQVRFEVKEMASQPPPFFMSTMHYRCFSPICVSVQNERKCTQYLSPYEENYGQQILTNLCKKQLANRSENTLELNDSFKLLSEPLSRLITIKPGTSAAVKVRGYTFDFEITLPVALHIIGYYAGFGEKNSIGFGCVKAIPGDLNNSHLAILESQKTALKNKCTQMQTRRPS